KRPTPPSRPRGYWIGQLISRAHDVSGNCDPSPSVAVVSRVLMPYIVQGSGQAALLRIKAKRHAIHINPTVVRVDRRPAAADHELTALIDLACDVSISPVTSAMK